MIHLTQLIYIKHGEEETFNEFESLAIPIISKYNGKLKLRIRPSEESIVQASIEKPYEIHLVEFDTQQDFDDFKKDEERKNFLHLKKQSIRASILIQGEEV